MGKERKKGERMAAQMKLALPPISKILVKLCLFAHILLVSIAFLGFAPGGFYLYLNLLFFGLLLLHLHLPTLPRPCTSPSPPTWSALFTTSSPLGCSSPPACSPSSPPGSASSLLSETSFLDSSPASFFTESGRARPAVRVGQ